MSWPLHVFSLLGGSFCCLLDQALTECYCAASFANKISLKSPQDLRGGAFRSLGGAFRSRDGVFVAAKWIDRTRSYRHGLRL